MAPESKVAQAAPTPTLPQGLPPGWVADLLNHPLLLVHGFIRTDGKYREVQEQGEEVRHGLRSPGRLTFLWPLPSSICSLQIQP